jgi:hypothetical protein
MIEILQSLEEHAVSIMKMGESSSILSVNSYNMTQHRHSENNILHRPVFLYIATITLSFDIWYT